MVLTIILAYQVVTDNSQTGTITATSQQRSLLIQDQDQVQLPRKAFKRDLKEFLLNEIQKHHELLLVGDFNEAFGSEGDGISNIASDLQLINLMTAQHSTKLPATYSTGRKCLDYGMATRKAADSLLSCGYEAFNERFSTDHRAYFFDFDTERLFGNDTQVLSSPSLRILKSNNIEQVTQYVKLKYDYLSSRNAFRRADQLCLPGDRHLFAERLDADVTKASLDAEKIIKRFGEPAWSIALSKARKKVNFLRKCMSRLRTGINHDRILQAAKDTDNIDLEIPKSRQECKEQLRAARTEIKTLVRESYQRRDQERNNRIQELEQSLLTADKAEATRLRKLRRAEHIKLMFDKLKSLKLKRQKQGVTRLEIPQHPDSDPKSCTEWRNNFRKETKTTLVRLEVLHSQLTLFGLNLDLTAIIITATAF